jgi:hypothetical protein
LLVAAALSLALFSGGAEGFTSSSHVGRGGVVTTATTTSSTTTTALAAVGGGTAEKDEDYMRWARQSRSAEASDVIVELPRPLGLVLNADEQGNVYVEKVAPKGNAARTGKACNRSCCRCCCCCRLLVLARWADGVVPV